MPAFDRSLVPTTDEFANILLPTNLNNFDEKTGTLPSPPPSENGITDRSESIAQAQEDILSTRSPDRARSTVRSEDRLRQGQQQNEQQDSESQRRQNPLQSVPGRNGSAYRASGDCNNPTMLAFTQGAPNTRTFLADLTPDNSTALQTESLDKVDIQDSVENSRLKLDGDLSPQSLPVKPFLQEVWDKQVADEYAPATRATRISQDHQDSRRPRKLIVDTMARGTPASTIVSPQPRPVAHRALSTPANMKGPDPLVSSAKSRSVSKSEGLRSRNLQAVNGAVTSPMTTSIPLPPLSLPTYLQLELSSHRPSQLYIDRSSNSDFPYESSRVKIERLLNFLLLPHQLELVLWFGTLACLDCWLYTFTILPLRLLKSIYILVQTWISNTVSEIHFLSTFVFSGTRRVWRRRRTRGDSVMPESVTTKNMEPSQVSERASRRPRNARHHRRSKSVPSTLLPDDKADILKSLLIIATTLILLRLDASRMYHWVRGQAAIKLYVIYNVLEVGDRLLSAIGQDVLECLFSREALERKPDGHSKVLRPFWLFILALAYTVTHATALFYQVVTLNVAVNSYSNALITLLMSNQFVEIKSTVFKKFEKENLFQLTCADVVERFQLWHMLMIIALRNIVETGGLNWGANPLASPPAVSLTSTVANGSSAATHAIPPWSASSILPSSFTILPSIVSSITSYVPTISHVLGPFVIVLGSEMLIDWLKHAYINKFNNTRPVIYGRFLDILAKDYYTNAFGDQNLTKRLGLPVIPLSCLMIRASIQTYQIFVAAWLPSPSASSASLAKIHEQYSASRASMPTSTAGVVARKIDEFLYQIPSTLANSATTPHFTNFLIALLGWLVLLACKLILGILLLAFARSRYRQMRERERNPGHHVEGGRRVGGWGVVEVDEDKRRWIYDDDPAALRALKDRDAKESAKKEQEKEKGGNIEGLDKVKRYEMVAKRIW